jgi:hypothetical protein
MLLAGETGVALPNSRQRDHVRGRSGHNIPDQAI